MKSEQVYTMVVDDGKPSTYEQITFEEMKAIILEIQEESKEDDFTTDIFIYDEEDQEVTEKILKNILKED